MTGVTWIFKATAYLGRQRYLRHQGAWDEGIVPALVGMVNQTRLRTGDKYALSRGESECGRLECGEAALKETCLALVQFHTELRP